VYANINLHPVRFETLEHRLFFAVTVSPTVEADRSMLQADRATLKSDRLASLDVLAQDRVTVAQNRHLRTAPDPTLVAKLSADKAAVRDQLKQDRLTAANTRLTDGAVVHSDRVQIHADRGNATALAADLVKLSNDQAKLTSDTAAARAAILLDATTDRTTLDQDRTAIRNSRGFDGAALTAALSTLATDRARLDQTLQADFAKITADRQQLFSDVRIGA
jgi:hypothetical protein